VSCGKYPPGAEGLLDPSGSLDDCLFRGGIKGIGPVETGCDDEVKEVLPLLPLLMFPTVRLILDRFGLPLIVDTISDIDLFGGLGMDGTPSIGFGAEPLLTGVFVPTPSLGVAAEEKGIGVPTPFNPVGSSSSLLPSSEALTSLIYTAKICCGRSLAMVAYSSRSCSPESPIRMNRESRKLSRISRIPARLRVAGAERRPLKRERPAYDFRRTEPGKINVRLWL